MRKEIGKPRLELHHDNQSVTIADDHMRVGLSKLAVAENDWKVSASGGSREMTVVDDPNKTTL